ncbi:[NiFe]-hydrogenase assembly chaperone HybE [Cohaesibacter gelatinilyticus]|uniref:[NiFe] hydrogenase assembly chaperone, HybE family n=1 Tax=Cohaesibacter gelatinilyticus TaxID=372072 RepID=A0A285PI90_9HYPH|nr:[NiFe]-hydrogenase assembly chaperone HybE [Cohaesibacter gelatinilyticus]SNZ21450.1 [NiFe] hydrogenase assembly chaperone, HybE family [Cohaesibacter gelatinilyticus]
MTQQPEHKDELSSGANICARIEALFETIEQERMKDVPILNDALSVAAFGFETPDAGGELSTYRVGVLLTPWFMNLMLLPLRPSQLDGQSFGEKQSHRLPAGHFEFVVGREEELGAFLTCSLFSPVFQFADQETACQTAKAVLEEVLRVPEEPTEQSQAEQDMQAIWKGELPEPETEEIVQPDTREPAPASLSRREVLRGLRPSSKESQEVRP